MLYGNVSVADEPGFVVVTQLVKENREGYLDWEVEDRGQNCNFEITRATVTLASHYVLSCTLDCSLFFFPSWNFLASIAMYQVGEFL